METENKLKIGCPSCGCLNPRKTYDAYWCDWCDNEFNRPIILIEQ